MTTETDRRLNDFAKRSFRDVADRDYIAARMACRANLTPQFMWSAQPAIEKYLKYLLLVHRIPATRVKHSIEKALDKAKALPFKLELRAPGRKLIDHLADYGEYRYLDVSYFIEGYVLGQLDMAVWDLRRYCHTDLLGRKLTEPPQEWRIAGGQLEQILDDKKSPARAALIWQNLFFGSRRRSTAKLRNHLEGANAPLYLYPDMLDELLKYVHVPERLADEYRLHLAEVLADPAKRP